MIISKELARDRLEKRKKLIELLSREGYLRPDHDYNQIKFKMCEPTEAGVEIALYVQEDGLQIDLVVPFEGVFSKKEEAYDYCSDIANEILDKQTDARRFDHNYFSDDIIFHYSFDLDKSSPDLVIRQLRLAVDVSRNGPF